MGSVFPELIVSSPPKMSFAILPKIWGGEINSYGVPQHPRKPARSGWLRPLCCSHGSAWLSKPPSKLFPLTSLLLLATTKSPAYLAARATLRTCIPPLQLDFLLSLADTRERATAHGSAADAQRPARRWGTRRGTVPRSSHSHASRGRLETRSRRDRAETLQ